MWIIYDKEKQLRSKEEVHHLGHEGVYKTYNRPKRDFYWGNIKRNIQQFIKCCHKYQICLHQKLNKFTGSTAFPPDYPFSRIGLDLKGSLPRKKDIGNIIVLVDYLNKWIEAEPLPSAESLDVINFLRKTFARHGIPEILITDNLPKFT